MKRIVLAAIIGVASIFSMNQAKAQLNVSINIGSQPLWGPTGYDHVDYYYLPEVDAYYDVPTAQYIYQQNGRWIWSSALPARYRNFDLYRTYKVVMNGNKPYLQHSSHLNKYKNYRTTYNKQTPIRDSRDKKYQAARGNNRPVQQRNEERRKVEPRPSGHDNNDRGREGRH